MEHWISVKFDDTNKVLKSSKDSSDLSVKLRGSEQVTVTCRRTCPRHQHAHSKNVVNQYAPLRYVYEAWPE